MSLDTYFTAYFKNNPGVITPRPDWYDSDDTHYQNHNLETFSFRAYQHPLWTIWSVDKVSELDTDDTTRTLSRSEISKETEQLKSFLTNVDICPLLNCFNSDVLDYNDTTEEELKLDLIELIGVLQGLLDTENFDFLSISLSY